MASSIAYRLCVIALLALSVPAAALAGPAASGHGGVTAASTGLRNFAFVTGEASGWRQYAPRPAPVFKLGEAIQFYAETEDLGWSAAGRGYRFELRVDVEVRTLEGQIVWGQKDFGRLARQSPVLDPNTYITGKLALEGLAPGIFVLSLRLRDPRNGRMAEHEMAFAILPPAPGIDA